MKIKCKRCAGFGYTVWAPTQKESMCDACGGTGIMKKQGNMDSIQEYLDTLDNSQRANLDVLKVRKHQENMLPEQLVDMKQRLETYKGLVAPINKEIAELQAQIWIHENRVR